MQHEETIRQHHQRQVPVQAVPVPALEVVQTTFLLGIFVKTAQSPTVREPV
ncbi:MAG TPA: hypothetical protein VFA41_24540 [Ktedonobacteraceae bacterium]|nr:hypothetical protein [Ktedonobacteraceae bacterium]